MPRPCEGPRLYLRKRTGRAPVWVILDTGRPEQSTGCRQADREGAETALAVYITEKYEPPKTGGALRKTIIADVVNVYLRERAPKTADGGTWLSYMAAPVLDWWGEKTLSTIRAQSCDDYVTWRTRQSVSDQTARHELKTLRAAIRYYHANYGPLDAVPVVTLPAKSAPRQDYWLTRKQVADRLRIARKNPRTRHIVRLLLIGVYSGTRPGTALKLRWLPSTEGGWVDLDSETLHRRSASARRSKKKATPARIHTRLLPWLRRWKEADKVLNSSHVIHYFGKPAVDVRNAWKRVAIAAGQAGDDGPHIARHTAATWLMQSDVDQYQAAGYLGMSPETLWSVYGHHSPSFQKEAASSTGKRAAQTSPKESVNADRTNRQGTRAVGE